MEDSRERDLTRQRAAESGEDERWLRVRFYSTAEDYRPIYTPPALPVGPWWCTGHRGSDDAAVIVAYAKSLDDIKRQWPEAEEPYDSVQENDEIIFTDRFPKPEWWP